MSLVVVIFIESSVGRLAADPVNMTGDSVKLQRCAVSFTRDGLIVWRKERWIAYGRTTNE